MKKQLSCEQVNALLNFYVEGCLSDILAKYVKLHINQCQNCMENYLKLKNIMDKYSAEDSDENVFLNKQYEIFRKNLSAYIDNELDDQENIKIKKIAISNPLARQDLEKIYIFKKILHDTFLKTKNELKTDYSKDIIYKIKQDVTTYKIADIKEKFIIIIWACVLALVFGFIMLLYS